MEKRRVFILCGFPGSGKSTWARKTVEDGDRVAVVNRDSLRTMLGSKYLFNPELELVVKDIAFWSVRTLLTHEYDVIIDETNLLKSKRAAWINIPDRTFTDISILWFTESEKNLDYRMTDPRGYAREKWDEVIAKMKDSFEPPDESEGVPIERIEIP